MAYREVGGCLVRVQTSKVVPPTPPDPIPSPLNLNMQRNCGEGGSIPRPLRTAAISLIFFSSPVCSHLYTRIYPLPIDYGKLDFGANVSLHSGLPCSSISKQDRCPQNQRAPGAARLANLWQPICSWPESPQGHVGDVEEVGPGPSSENGQSSDRGSKHVRLCPRAMDQKPVGFN